MEKNYITKGTRIDTAAGYLKVTDYNGSIVYCEEYIASETGDLDQTDDRMLTLYEIADLMREVDGQNHKVYWREPEED